MGLFGKLMMAVGAALVLGGPMVAIAGVGMLASGGGGPTLPEDAIEGTLRARPGSKLGTFASMEPFLFGEVGISAKSGPANTARAYENLLYESRGDPRVLLDTDRGPIEIMLADPMNRWFGMSRQQTDLADLRGIGAAEGLSSVEGARGYALTIIALRPGDRVAVKLGPDGEVVRLWFGGRAAMEQKNETRRSGAAAASKGAIGLGVVATFIGAALVVMGWINRG